LKAIRFHAKHDVRVDDVDPPSALADDDVLVRSTYCGICGTDLHEFTEGPIWTSATPNSFSGAALPQILGHEFAGQVERVGAGVTTLKAGDRVSIQPQVGPRDGYFGSRNLAFLSGRGATIGLSWPWGGMGEFAVVKDYTAVKLPDDVTDQQGALIEPAAVAVHAVDRSGMQPGGSILVTGAGPIGALAVLAARAAGAGRILVSEPNPHRRRRIEQLGVGAIVIDPTAESVADRVRQETPEGLGADAAVECAGNGRALQACIDAVRTQGVVVVVGLMQSKVEMSPFQWIIKDLTIQGSLCYPLTMWPRIIDMIRSGLFPVEAMIDDEIEMADIIDKGFKPLLDPHGAMMKILVRVHGKPKAGRIGGSRAHEDSEIGIGEDVVLAEVSGAPSSLAQRHP
jgi:(R,R)-butanediol dehydrogenase/meso-butanediol dehydrogenase/diacetyl reductase